MNLLLTILPLVILPISWLKNKSIQIILICFLIFIAGFRSIDIGTDTENYYLFYYRILNNYQFISRYEPLFQLLNYFVVKLKLGFEWVTFLSSVLTIIPLYFAFNKSSRFPLFSWFVYIAFCYYFQSFNIMRQSIAMSWVLLAICYLDSNKSFFDKKSNRKTIIYTIIAILFHYTAVLVLLIYFLNYILSKYKLWYPIQIGSFAFGLVLSGPLFKVLTSILPFYDKFEVKENFLSSLINLLILNIAFIFFMNIVKVKDKWFNLFFCYIVFTNLVLQLPFASRPLLYAGIALCIFFPNMIINNKMGFKLRPIICLIIISYCMFRYLRLYNGGEIFPYENVLYNF